MVERRGWLLDIYADEQDGLVLWLLGEDDGRYRLHQPFAVTFYATGPFPRLRALWRYLLAQPIAVKLARTQREDLFSGLLDVLAVEVANAARQPRLFRDVARRFPDLTYYDADIPLALRYTAVTGVFPLGRCHVVTTEDGQIQAIAPLDSPWDLTPPSPPLRTLTIEPDIDPFHADPTHLIVKTERADYQAPLKPLRLLLIQLQASLKRHDPDILLTRWGDTWLLPTLLAARQKAGVPHFNPNRDQRRQVVQRRENSYFTYGQVVYRGGQVHLFGRWHIDQHNAMMFGDYGLDGVFEQARVTGLPVQEVARKSPGAGITAMQMLVALRRKVLVPYQKQQAERFKTARDLLRSDRGGLVYQPLIGLHYDVAEIDFVSMYPSIMARFNISPETVGVQGESTQYVPELDVPVDRSRVGLVPMTLQPLLAKRIAIKQELAALNHRDCRYRPLKARSDALKWLLVVCFGYLGYKNARFGRIESHEAVTAYGREVLLQSKEVAEALGYTVLHMYVDGLWVKKAGLKTVDTVQPLLDAISAQTSLPIALEGVYRWIAFLPSRLDERVPVPNRYFGVFRDGAIKARGIEIRRRDTASYIAEVQLKILHRLARVPEGRPLDTCLPEIIIMLRCCLADLRAGRIPVEKLLVAQTLSRPVEEYRVLSPSARAAVQLGAAGKQRRPGQRIRFWYTRGEPGVHAWDSPVPLNPASLDTARYTDLLLRAADNVLQIAGLEERVLRSCLLSYAWQTPFPFFHASVNSVWYWPIN